MNPRRLLPTRLLLSRPGAWALRRPWLVAGIALGAVVIVLLLARGALGGRDPTWARIQATGVWRVGMDPSFPPFENLDPVSARPVGLDVDLAEAIAARWGVRVEFAGVGFDQLIDAVAAHRVDSAISALPMMPHRTREVAFSAPYVEAGLVLAAPPGSSLRGPADLAGLRVAVEWGSGGDAWSRQVQRQLEGNLQLVVRESTEAALAAVVAGEADAAIVDAVSLALFDGAGERLVPVGEPLTREPYVIVMPVDAPQLRAAVDATLASLAADGTLAQIKSRWLGPAAR